MLLYIGCALWVVMVEVAVAVILSCRFSLLAAWCCFSPFVVSCCQWQWCWLLTMLLFSLELLVFLVPFLLCCHLPGQETSSKILGGSLSLLCDA